MFQVVARLNPLGAAESLKCTRQLLAGLAHLHSAGMVHRDVKPANCLFVGRELKLADFGLGSLHDEASDLTQLTTSGSRLGTPAWMAPEQIDDVDLSKVPGYVPPPEA